MTNSNTGNCKFCGKEFTKRHSRHYYCDNNCKENYYKSNKKTKTEVCSNCKKEYIVRLAKFSRDVYDNHFCSRECQVEFRRNLSYETKHCKVCGKEMYCPKSDVRVMCSRKCQGIWQSRNRQGEKSPCYKHDFSHDDRTLRCEICGKTYEVSPCKLETSRFCSNDCRRYWFANIYSQTNEVKERSRNYAIDNLVNGKIPQVNTKPQIAVNKILDSLGIKYENEKPFKYYLMDNYLPEFNLAIEVMGGYWHCDRRTYKKLKYTHQYNRVIKDRMKRTCVRTKFGINILYLWEYDIENNPDLCKMLIQLYVSESCLESYHSSDYILSDGKLVLNIDKQRPYMELSKNEVLELSEFNEQLPLVC